MPEPGRSIDATGDAPPALLAPGPAADLTRFARACRAAAGAVSLYPHGHPSIDATLARLAVRSTEIAAHGPFSVQALADRLLVDGAGLARPEPAVAELGALLHRHSIGTLTVNPGAGVDSWRTLLLLLARAPEDVRDDGGIAHLWATAGGPSIEIREIDYAEVLRDKQGHAATIEAILSAATGGPQGEFDEALARMVRSVIGDPAQTEALMKEIAGAGAGGPDGVAAIFLNLLRGMVRQAAHAAPGDLKRLLEQLGEAAGRLSAPAMSALLHRQGAAAALVGSTDVVSAAAGRMSDRAVAGFVARSVVEDHGATARLAHAFSALAPEPDRQRRLLGLARSQLAESELADEASSSNLWQGVEAMLTSYTDATFVSAGYARELSSARTQPVDLEAVTDDPGDRIAAWLSTVGDGALRELDHALLVDLLTIEGDPLRWRDMAGAAVAHADDLVRVGHFDEAWQVLEAVIAQGGAQPERASHAAAALARFGRGAMMKHVAAHLRTADDTEHDRFTRLCHAIGAPVIQPIAEALAEEQDARSRRRLRDTLVGFGPRGRETVQQLMTASNWEVRRTAAYLLREFGGAEGLKELIPLLNDPEPLVQRAAIQGLVLNGSPQACDILLGALTDARGAARDSLAREILAVRDERASSITCHFVRRANRRTLPAFYLGALDAVATSRSDDAVAALDAALRVRDWRSPRRNRQFRAAAAQSLRLIGTPAALEALRAVEASGPTGARAAARTELARLH